MERVRVTIHIEIADEAKEFSTVASTNGEPTRVADGLLQGLGGTAAAWLREKRLDAAEVGYRA